MCQRIDDDLFFQHSVVLFKNDIFLKKKSMENLQDMINNQPQKNKRKYFLRFYIQLIVKIWIIIHFLGKKTKSNIDHHTVHEKKRKEKTNKSHVRKAQCLIFSVLVSNK